MDGYSSFVDSSGTGVPPGSWEDAIDWLQICRDHPDLAECAQVPSFYGYRIDPSPNIVFAALFGFSLIGYALVYLSTRHDLVFGLAMALGILCEILGYVARLLSWGNQWDEDWFLMQVCCLTIGPAFMAAGIYLCLRRVVEAFGPENSRIAPKYYTWFVCRCPFSLP